MLRARSCCPVVALVCTLASSGAHARAKSPKHARHASPAATVDAFATARGRRADGAVITASGLAMADLRHASKVPVDANWTPALWLRAPADMQKLLAPAKVSIDASQAPRRCPHEYELSFYRGHDGVADGWISTECNVWVPADARGRRLRVEGTLIWRLSELLTRAKAGEAWLVRVTFPVATPVARAHETLARAGLPSLDRAGERGRRPSVTLVSEAATARDAKKSLQTLVRSACRARACRVDRATPRPSPLGATTIVAATVIGEDEFRIDDLCKRASDAGLKCEDRSAPKEYALDTVVPFVPSQAALTDLQRKLGVGRVEAVPSL